MSASVDIVWLRDDFRLDDQPSIRAAADRPALFVYVHDAIGGGARPLGGAAKWRLAKSLSSMEIELSARGARLDIVRGEPMQAILALAAAANASRVLWTRRYEGGATALDARVKAALRERGVEALSFNGRLLREPWELAKAEGAPIGSFSAFWRRHRALGPLPAPTPAPKRLTEASWPREAPERVTIDALRLTPTAPDWASELALGETPGEAGRASRAQGIRPGDAADLCGRARLASRPRPRRACRRTCASARFRRAASPMSSRPPATPLATLARREISGRTRLARLRRRAAFRPSRSRDASIARRVRALSLAG